MQEGIAAVCRGADQELSLEKIFVDDPQDNEILVRIASSGICHTDVTLMKFGVFVPGVHGHEGAGEVVKVGKNVRKVKPGDHVVMCMVYGCGYCSSCLHGMPMSCLNYNMMVPQACPNGESTMKDADGNPLAHGPACSFANYTITEEKAVIKIDPSMSLKMAGILACGVQTGAGTVGLSALMAAKISKCYPIIAVDINPFKLEMAKKFGATHTTNSSETNPVEAIKAIVSGGVKFAVDTVGHEIVTVQVIQSTAPSGFTIMLGALSMDRVIPIPIMDILGVNRRIQGVSEGGVVPDLFIPKLISLYQAGELPVDELITYYTFKDINKAMHDFEAGKSVKPVVLFD